MEDFSFESEFYNFKYEKGIFFGTYISGPITLEVAKSLVSDRLRLTNSKSVLMLVTVKDLKGMDREARSYLSSEEGIKGVKAGAIVVKSPFTTHMANFFMKISFNKSKMPAKVFSHEEEAIIWLRKFE
ncbi:MAG: hypothetical protein GQ574_20205 [Crocinitomix sp.]|nr:hypothetical protein [Crocinitomix sp.]